MKILMLLGSPRKGGNGDTLAKAVGDAAIAAGATVDYVRLNDLQIRPCQGCGGCEKTGNCVIKDDMQELYRQADEADRIFLVSPVYFYGLSAQCKLFGDRMQAQWSRRYLLKNRFRKEDGRKGYLISTAATEGQKIFDCSVLTTRYIFDAMEVQYGGDLLVKGVDGRKAILEYPEELQQAAEFGKKVAEGSY